MEMRLDKMCDWERKKAVFLMGIAEDMGMDVSGYGELAVNENSGNTYLWLEDHPFTLYMPISCELKRDDVWAAYDCVNCGEEYEISIADKSYDNLVEWTTSLTVLKDDEYRCAVCGHE